MCALHPDMRADWAASWARLLKSGGLLKTLIFPVDPERQTGPPWPVTPEIYEELLTKNGGWGGVRGCCICSGGNCNGNCFPMCMP